MTTPACVPVKAAEDEPVAALKLFALCQGRRPHEGWSADDELFADTLIDELIALRLPWRKDLARGKWRLAYLQPGLDEVPRPFLGLASNEQYQIFSSSEVVSVAELLGPTLEVRAAGLWREDTPADMRPPKRFRSELRDGAICGSFTMGRSEKANIGRVCAPLPLRGETYRVFQGEYVGARIRIGQDLNSGGRVVQVKVDSFDGRRSRAPTSATARGS